MTDETEATKSLRDAIVSVESFAVAANGDDLATLQEMKEEVDSLRSTLEDRIEALEAQS